MFTRQKMFDEYFEVYAILKVHFEVHGISWNWYDDFIVIFLLVTFSNTLTCSNKLIKTDIFNFSPEIRYRVG